MAARPTTSELYACGSCNASYARADHLIRHVRSHTRQRPFTCSVCGKAFGRQDLLKRHLNVHVLTAAPDSIASLVNGSRHSQTNHRVHHACRACAEKKLKCADDKPCKRCQEKNLVCDWEQDFHVSRHKASDGVPSPPHVQTTDEQDANNPSLDQNAVSQENAQPPEPESTALVPPQRSQDLAFILSEPLLPNFLGDNLNFAPGGEFEQFDSGIGTDDMDFSFLTDFSIPEASGFSAFSPFSDVISQQSTVAVGAEAYKGMTSLSRWKPTKGEGHIREQQDLVLSQHVCPLTRKVHLAEPRAFPKKDLPQSLRDQILFMVLRTASRPISDRIVVSFPGADILRDLIYHAIQHFRDRQVGCFVHAPSFDLTQQRPELLGSLIAYACVCSPSQAVRNFGYALQDAVRIAINELVQDDQSALRDLDVAQAFYIQLYLGYWSGNSRMIEISECNSMLGATMLRRGERLRADNYGAPETFLSLSSASPEETWLKWVDQESAKRLVYFAMTLDSHVAAARSMNALFNLDEMNTPLPSSTKLWAASNPTEWLENMGQEVVLKTRQPPALSGLLRQPNLLAKVGVLSDMKAATSIYLAGFWVFIGEYWRMNCLSSNALTSNDFVLNARHAELKSILESFKTEVVDRYDAGVESRILHELVSLHLHVPFNDIAQYCGKGTEEDARASAAFVQRWYHTSQARTAVWHAGQIFRTSKLLSPGYLADIYVVALYHAGLILWTWALLGRLQTTGPVPNSQHAAIDGDETPETMRFIKTGQCRPYLTDRDGKTVSIEDLVMVPTLLNGIISANWDQEPMPSTTVQLFRFMHDISKVSSEKFGTSPG